MVGDELRQVRWRPALPRTFDPCAGVPNRRALDVAVFVDAQGKYE
jgi:hypothetical protein